MQRDHNDKATWIDWFPDWAPARQDTRTTLAAEPTPPDPPNVNTNNIQLQEINHEDDGGDEGHMHMEDVEAPGENPTVLPHDTLVIERDRDKAVK